MQTTLVNCYVSWDKVNRAANRDAYVYRVPVNAHISNRRRWWHREQPSDELMAQPVSAETTDLTDLVDTVRQALQGLSRESRAVVVVRYFADFTEEETAHVLGIPKGTVKSRLSRALRDLADDPMLSNYVGRAPQ